MEQSNVILKIRNLSMNFPLRSKRLGEKPQVLHALTNISLDVYQGETLGIIGESGCGKSTLGKCLMRLHQPTSGTIEFDGMDLLSLRPKQMKAVRKNLQMVFQDVYKRQGVQCVHPALSAGFQHHAIVGDAELFILLYTHAVIVAHLRGKEDAVRAQLQRTLSEVSCGNSNLLQRFFDHISVALGNVGKQLLVGYLVSYSQGAEHGKHNRDILTLKPVKEQLQRVQLPGQRTLAGITDLNGVPIFWGVDGSTHNLGHAALSNL